MATTHKKGRPAGTPNNPIDHLTQHPPACKACGGTSHTVLRRLDDQAHGGEAAGQKYNVIERRRVRCTGCGQVAIVRTYHMRPPERK